MVKVVLPGEWYLVRWGGTRKGAGTFYTRPQLAIPTAHRTLRPLAYDPPVDKDGQGDTSAAAEKWTPKKPRGHPEPQGLRSRLRVRIVLPGRPAFSDECPLRVAGGP